MTGDRPASLRFYAAAADAAAVLAPTWLGRRVRQGKEDAERWRERLGRAGAARPGGRIAWLHGVSVGEALSLIPLVARLRSERPEVGVLFTTGTRASAELITARLGASVIHQYAPLDAPAAARRFLDHWRPEVGVLVESELWPNLVLAARDRGVRLALLSAKVSEASLAGWRRVPAAARAVLEAFDLVLAKDERASARLAGLGARVQGLADLKFGALPLPVEAVALSSARRAVAGRPVILAASTHPGEEAPILGAFGQAPAEALLIIAPRHSLRGPEVMALARDAGLDAGLRTAGDGPGDRTVLVADTVGELGLWYRLAALALVGGSLRGAGVGGHNPLEPARLDCPFIAGAEVASWPVYQGLEGCGATRTVGSGDLAPWFGRAIRADPSLAEMAARAKAFVAKGDAAAADALDRALRLVPP